jgi:oligopeptide/dipeptide ABC transporter ATP-binding protein
MSSLNPYLPVGEQIAEVARLHLGFSRARAKGYAVQMLERVGVSSPESRSAQYPHQLSGGMRQRVMIAIAIAGKPRLLIADEPTASLDVTIQAQILNLLRALVHEEGLSMILVSHDLAVVAGVADRVAVMYRGRVVESASAGQIFSQPRHPYTRALIRSIPDPSRKGAPLYQLLDPVVTCEGLNPAGCSFVHRCPEALLHCQELPPPVRAVQPGHLVRCWIDPP